VSPRLRWMKTYLPLAASTLAAISAALLFSEHFADSLASVGSPSVLIKPVSSLEECLLDDEAPR
jgi:hypothetical protein